MSDQKRRLPAGAILLSAMLLLAASLAAQPPEAGAAIPIAELTADRVRTLADEQLILVGERQVTLGELREERVARRVALDAAFAAYAASAPEELEAVRARVAGRQQERLRAESERVAAMLEHLRRIDGASPEAVRRARALSAQRREMSRLLVERSEATTEAARKRIDRKVRKVQRSVEPPGG